MRHAATDAFEPGLRSFFEYRELGITTVTAGRIGAHVIRAVPGSPAQP